MAMAILGLFRDRASDSETLSDLPSAVNVSAEQEAKGQKRNGSPSLLAACSRTCTKKQCISDQACPAHQLEDSSSTKDCAEIVKTEHPSGESAFNTHGESDSGGVGCLSLRRCSKTQNSGVNKSSRTSASVSRSSVFFSGDEFWNEAIQVADWLFDPMEDMPLKDELSCAARHDARNIYRSTSNKLGAKAGVLADNVKPIEKYVKPIEKDTDGDSIFPAALKQNDGSPLPVKHFDFSHEGDNVVQCNSGYNIEEVATETGVGSGMADSSSLRHSHLQIGTDVLLSDESLATRQVSEPNSNVISLLPENLGQIQESVSNLAVNEKKSGFSTQKNDINHTQSDKLLDSGGLLSRCNVSTKENTCKGRSAAHSIPKEATMPSSSMPLLGHLQITSWLPYDVCNIYMKKGISKLYPWQVDCLLVDGVLEKRNLVYCASTSAGKSFVAEILMLRRVISTDKMALIVFPYVSICAEKAEHLELLLEPLGKHVRSFYGNQGGGSLPKDTSVAVCTIEKANSLINRLLEEGRLSEVGIIVIDELHMVGDQRRGYLLELMLTKLRYAAGEGNTESNIGDSSGSSSGKADPSKGTQIVGMSATMPNVASVTDWLQAALYETDFRPVPLEEYIKIGNSIFDKKMNIVRVIPKTADLGGKDPDHIVELCNEVVQEGHSVLLFCSSRKGCESTARHVSRLLRKSSQDMRKLDCDYDDAFSALEALQRCPAGLDPVLEETLPCGVAFHHAGLTVEEREIIETCYRKGIIRVLTATSTLAAGVNLPARRVIFRQPRIGRDFIDGTKYRQMAGRAGRTGIDTRGESILVCKPDEVKRVAAILNDSCPPLQSCLSEDKNGMTHAILEVVAGGIVQTASDINWYVRCTLLNSTKAFQDVVKSAQDSLRWLCHKKFLEWNEDTKLYSTTPLGRAAFGSSLTPEESLVVLDDLSRAREGFVLASDLHLVYLVTPINVEVEPDWELYYERFMQLPALDQSVGNRVGVAEPFLMRMAHGAPMPVKERSRREKSGLGESLQKKITSSDAALISSEQTLRVCRRFYVALMLSRLVQEVPVADVCEAFKVARGMIQSLQENAGRFAQMLSVFCERLGWHDLEGLVAKFQNRVSFGVRAEIVELTMIPYVKGSRARALYKAGLRTPPSIAEASIPQIAKALFESSSWVGQEGSVTCRVQMGLAKKIKNGARKIVLDQAEEARIAAFSTFKSLGVDIPKGSRPLLSSFAGAPPVQADCFEETTTVNPEVAYRTIVNGTNVIHDKPLDITGETFTVTMNMRGKAVEKVCSVVGESDGCKLSVDKSVLNPPSASIYPPGKLPDIEHEPSRAACYTEVRVGCDSEIVEKNFSPNQKEQEIGSRNGSGCSNNKEVSIAVRGAEPASPHIDNRGKTIHTMSSQPSPSSERAEHVLSPLDRRETRASACACKSTAGDGSGSEVQKNTMTTPTSSRDGEADDNLPEFAVPIAMILQPNSPVLPRIEVHQYRQSGDDSAMRNIHQVSHEVLGSRGNDKSDEGQGSLQASNFSPHSLVVAQQPQIAYDALRPRPPHDPGDITKGQERVKIPLANEISNEKYPSSFHYISRSQIYQKAYVNISHARIGDEECCSDCFGDCFAAAIPCGCARVTGGEFAYTSDGLVKETILDECVSLSCEPRKHRLVYCQDCPSERSKDGAMIGNCKGHLVRKFIKECWNKCGCSMQCKNRIVQRGITCNLQVFFTLEGKGWGLRTLHELPRGTFVCEYVGEVLTNMELYDRRAQSIADVEYTLHVLLDAEWGSKGVLKDEEAMCLDATFYGNVARFVNHRCVDANLIEIPVEIETPDHHYYHVAFFTTRKIEQYEELTWDYGIDFHDVGNQVKAFKCRCGSKSCRDMKRSIPTQEIKKVKENLKRSMEGLENIMVDPLPSASMAATRVTEGKSMEVLHRQEQDPENQNIVDVGGSSHPSDEGSGCTNKDLKVSGHSLLYWNPTARSYEWDDESIESSLPTPRATKVSRSERPAVEKVAKKRIKWSVEETDTLREAVNERGKGNWKIILNEHRHAFCNRTEVDLKDKWRNMTKP